MHNNKLIKKAIVIGTFLFLLIASAYSSVGNTYNEKKESSAENIAYIQGGFTVDCWLYQIDLDDPGDANCFCPDFPGSGSGGTLTNDAMIITSEYGTGAIYEIDPLTCDFKIIGGGGVSLNGLAFDPIDEEIYACTNDDLYKIYRQNGSQEYIGRFGTGVVNMIGLACDADGVLYGWDLGDNLWTINKKTGLASLVGPLGIDLNYAQDGDFHKVNDILYLAAFTSSQESLLYECDEDSGSCTLVGQFQDNTQVTLFTIPWNYPPSADFNWIPVDPDPGETILFDASISSDPDNNIVLYEWDWDNDGIYDESQTEPTTTHVYEEAGLYNITLQVQDYYNQKDTKTYPVKVGNRPPEKPIIEYYKRVSVYYWYNLTPIDLDGDTLYVRWDWDDGDISEWSGPYTSGEQISDYHEYKRGRYTIKAQVKDEFGAESEWGELEVNIPRNHLQQNLVLLRVLERFPLVKQIIGFLGWYNWLGY